jgi:hypothetical protein
MNIKELQALKPKLPDPKILKPGEMEEIERREQAAIAADPRVDPAAGEMAIVAAEVTPEIRAESAQRLEIEVQKSGLVGESAHELVAKFAPLMAEAKGFADTAKSIAVTDESQVQAMKLARATRLALRAVRIRAEKLRKDLKADSLQRGKAIDGIYNLIAYLVTPIEDRLEAAENFAEAATAARAQKLKDDREELLRPYSIDTGFYDLAAMPADTFGRLLEDTQRSHESKVAEKIRIEKDKQESDRLAGVKKERESRLALFGLTPLTDNRIELLSDRDFETMLAAAKKNFDAEAARLKKEKEAEDARQKQLEADAEKGRKAQRDLEARQKADRDAEAERGRQAAKLKRAPDKTKLETFAGQVATMRLPEMKTDEGKAACEEINEEIAHLVVVIRAKAKEL